MKTQILVPAGTLLLGGVIGFVLPKSEKTETKPEVSIIEVKAKSDPRLDGAEQLGRALSTEEILNQAGTSARVQGLMDFYLNLDPALYAEEARKLEDLPWSERLIASYLLFSAWGEQSPREALVYADSMGFASRMVKPTILQSWAGVDPAHAAQYYTDNKSEFAAMNWGRRGGRSAAPGVAKEWARQDPQSALAWALSLEGNESGNAAAGVFQQVAQDDPAKAAEMLSESGAGSNRDGAIDAIAAQWGKEDFAASEAWANTLTGDERFEALAEGISGLAQVDAEAAAEKALSLPSGEYQDDAVESVAEEMSRTDADGALSWLMDKGSEAAQVDAIGDVISNLARTDDSAAYSWVNDQEAGPLRDEAAAHYVFSNRSADSQSVIDVAMLIEDDGRRERSVARAAGQWLQNDREAAQAFIESTDAISDRRKERLLR